MLPKTSIRIQLLVYLCLVAFLVSCSTGPAPAARGTPAWYWQAANQSYSEGEYLLTVEHLESLVKPGNEYADRAQPWRLILTAGLAHGYCEAAGCYEAGSRTDSNISTECRRQMNNYRSLGDKMATQFAETYMAFAQGKAAGAIPVAFSFPIGSTSTVVELERIAQGIPISANEMVNAEQQALKQGVVLVTSAAVGAGDDAAKAKQLLTGENVTIPRDTFLLAVAEKLNEFSEFYAQDKLGKPDKRILFKQKALEALQTVPETEKSRLLMDELEAELKESGA